MPPVPSLADFPPLFLIVFAVALGLVLGSFLNVVIYRLPRGDSIAFPGSHCPQCGQPIKPRDNVPVLSYLLLGGRARCCKAPISPRYPLVEAIGGLLAWAVMRSIVLELPGDPSLGRALAVFGAYLALGLALVAAAFIDLEHMLLPDELTLGGAGLGIATVPLRPDITFKEAILGAAIGFLVVWLPFIVLYEKVRGRPGMGLGEAAFYSYAYPQPPGFRDSPVEPPGARFDAALGEFILPYEVVRTAADPDALLLSFLQSTYEAAAGLAGWDRAALEGQPPPSAQRRYAQTAE
jgi:prepilin signal peptidase PulO-like enzyme (type II secretory pathway)